MKTLLCALVLIALLDPGLPPIGSPPAELRLDAFYQKHLDVGGLPVVGSAKVSDYALREAAYIVGGMLERRPDVLRALARNGVRLAVMASSEMTTDIPEHSDLTPARWWDKRARGLGPTRIRPAVSCGEENLLGYAGDPYRAENILVHEFAHAIHQMGLVAVDPTFDARLKTTYKSAMTRGLWKDKYAARNAAEYWAEGVQSWFDTNRPPDHDHNHVDTRAELEEYDPELADLISAAFRGVEWRYRRPADRRPEDRGHLKGFDRSKAPRFEWPAGLVEWYRRYEAEKRAGRGSR